jgi:phage repressor protein C with HTH and peptisase S24 domain
VNNLADRIRWAMNRSDLSQAELARRVGLKQPSIHGWLSGKARFLKGENLLSAASALGVDPDWLATGAGSPDATPGLSEPRPRQPVKAYDVEAVEDGGPIPETHAAIEHIDFKLSAGDGSEVPVFVETRYPMLYRIDWFHRHRAKPEHVKSMGVRGASMERTLFDGDRVAVHVADRIVTNDHVYALLLDGEAVVKRVFRHGVRGIRIVSDSDDKGRYPDLIIDADDVDARVSILGRVIDKSGAGGL